MNPAFWRGRRVLITGDTGFKGYWLCEWLVQLGAEITGCGLPADQPSLYASRGANWDHRDLDLRQAEPIRTLISGCRPELVLHLAAQPLVRAAHAQPLDTFAVNVMGTAHLLDACRGSSVSSIVAITTDKCYENPESGEAFREDDPLGGHEPYSASKACAEHVCSAYRQSYFANAGVGLATARAGNVIGAGDYAADRILPDAIRAQQAGQALSVRNPAAVRPWQHVLEPLAGYLQLAERLSVDPHRHARAWNFGPALRDCLPVAQLLAEWQRLWPDWVGWQTVPATGPVESRLLRLDWSLAREQLGWAPRLGLSTALQWTIEGYRQIAAGGSSPDWLRRQISEYSLLQQQAHE